MENLCKDFTMSCSLPGENRLEDAELFQQMHPDLLSTILLQPEKNLNPYVGTSGSRSIFEKLRHNHYTTGNTYSMEISVAEWKSIHNMSLNDQMDVFLEDQLLTPNQQRQRWQCATDLLIILRQYFPHCQLYVIGSHLAGLSDTHSSLNMFLELNWDLAENKRVLPLYFLRSRLVTAKCVHDPNSAFISGKIGLEAKSGRILNFQHRASLTQCNVLLDSKDLLVRSTLLQFYVDFDPRVKPFLALLGYWATYYNIVANTKLPMYGLNLMALSYLTQKKIVPSMLLLQTLASETRNANGITTSPLYVEGWDCTFCTDRDAIFECFDNLPVPEDYEDQRANIMLGMVREFFDLLWNTHITTSVMFPRLGRVFPKECFLDMEMGRNILPEVLLRWSERFIDADELCEIIGIYKPLLIMDPFLRDNNVAAAVDEAGLTEFCEAARDTQLKLEKGVKCIVDLFCRAIHWWINWEEF